MKTATSPQNQFVNPHRLAAGHAKGKSLTLIVAAFFTLGIGSLPLIATAQDPASRTIATGSGIPLSADAPDRYTVKKGDTLWDIAKVFLRDPWYWPEIWYVNPQVKNPHLIYPGDVLALVSMDGRPQVSVAERGPEGAAAEAAAESPASSGTSGPVRTGPSTRLSPHVRSQPITAAVTAIPYSAVAAFMGRPSFLTKDQVKSVPYVMGIRDRHLIGGQDNDIYASGIRQAPLGSRYNIVHIGDKLRDPENNDVLGYRGVYAGSATVTGSGEPAKMSADKTEREVLRGDKIFADEITLALDFLPHPVPENVKGSIMAVDGITIAGKYQIVALNRGTKQGLESGHVLAISQKGERVRDIYKEGDKPGFWSMGKNVKLPNERIGVVMVFKTYERMSYALIMEATHPVRVGDLVAAP